MNELERLYIVIEAQTKEVSKAVNTVNKQLGGIQKTASKTTSKMGASFAKFGKILIGVFAAKELDGFIRNLISINEKAEEFKITMNQAFQNISNSLTSVLEPIVKWFAIALNFIAGAIAKITKTSLASLKKIATGAKKAVKVLMGFDELNVITEPDAGSNPALPIIDANKYLEEGYKWWEKWGDIITVIAAILAGGAILKALFTIGSAVGAVITAFAASAPLLGIFSHFVESGSILGNIFIWIQGLLDSLYVLFMKLFFGVKVVAEGTVAAALAPVVFILAIIAVLAALWQAWQENLFGIREVWKEVWDNIVSLFSAAWDHMKVFIDIAIKLLMAIWEYALKPLWDRFVEFVAVVAVFVGKLINALMPIIRFLIDIFMPIFQALFALAGLVFTGLVIVASWAIGMVLDGLTRLFEIFNLIIDFLVNVFTGKWDKAFDNLVSIVGKIVEPIVKPFRTAFNFIADLWNKTIGGFKVDFLGVKFTVPTMPKWTAAIPQLARGGMPEVGSAFIAGEAGSELIGSYGGKQTVMPLENSDFTYAMKQAVMEGIMEGSQGGDLTLTIDGMVLAKATEKNLNKLATIQGGLNLGV